MNLMLSVQITLKGLQNWKRILKQLALRSNRDLQDMGSCLPSHGGDVVDGGELVEVGGTVVLLEGVVDLPGKRMTYIGGRGVTERRILRCRYRPSTPTPSSFSSVSHPGKLINNY